MFAFSVFPENGDFSSIPGAQCDMYCTDQDSISESGSVARARQQGEFLKETDIK